MEFGQQLRLIVGDENVGGFDQPDESLVAVGTREIERDTFFVPVSENPTPVQLRLRSAGQMGKEAPEIAAVGTFDLEDFGAEIRHDSGRGRTSDVGAAVDDPD